ncbi:ferritin-like domain-containing protein [Auriculariales sp. MPI-PUGE-AT-0066]|nr:ferritin-like domain-containing protein [Auriculariales sp. MPI-PUGE-AT-0066]
MLSFSSALLALAACAITVVHSAPTVTDDDILQYALTLEHLESAFYSGALEKLKASDFAAGGEQHALFEQIAGHEAAHVSLLQTVLGDKATKACNYSFPYTDVQSFKALAQVLEGVGVTAYLGAAQYITNPAYLTAAGAILTTEARHAAWLASTNSKDPWSGPYDTPLGFSQVYSLAAGFITGCPESNPKLPVTAFPALTAANSTDLKSGQSLTLTVPGDFKAGNGSVYVAFLNGLTPIFVPYTTNQSVTIPSGINATGTVYAVLTSSNATVTDENTLAGPAILMFNPQYPSGVVTGSSTGGGSGMPGTDGNGNTINSDGSTTGSGTGAASSVALSSTIVVFTVALTFLALV